MAGRPSRWALAHILVFVVFDLVLSCGVTVVFRCCIGAIIMVALWNRADHYIFTLSFVLFSSFFFLA